MLTRFWSKVDKSPGYGPAGDCWRWTSCTDKDGYGLIGGFFSTRAHRLSFAIANRDIPVPPPELHVCHRCDNPGCVNPDHLFLGTGPQNHADKCAKRRQARGPKHSKAMKDREFRGTKHPLSKLTDDDIRAIRSDDRAQRKIAKSYGISQPLVSKIVRLEAWTHVVP